MMRLSEAQKHALRAMATDENGEVRVTVREPGHWLRTCKSLELRGLAEYQGIVEFLVECHEFCITDAGRIAAESEQQP